MAFEGLEVAQGLAETFKDTPFGHFVRGLFGQNLFDAQMGGGDVAGAEASQVADTSVEVASADTLGELLSPVEPPDSLDYQHPVAYLESLQQAMEADIRMLEDYARYDHQPVLQAWADECREKVLKVINEELAKGPHADLVKAYGAVVEFDDSLEKAGEGRRRLS